MSRIYTYLNSISSGQPINFEAFAKELKKHGKGAGYLFDTFSTSKIGKSSYQVAVLREDRFAELIREHAPSEVTGRIGAAFDGSSHAAAVSGSLLITRSVVHPHPSVVLLSKHGWEAPNTLRPAALLVENLENFLALKQTVDILADCGVVLYAVASIRSYRYDVEVISKSLQRYVHQNERQRREYDQVESVFNDLLVACRELHDGKLRGNLIPKDHEVLVRFSTFKGMKRQRADSKIEWHNVDHWLHIQEHLRSSLDSLKNTQVTTTSVEPVGEDVLKARRALDVHRKLIGRLIDEWPVQVGPDAHASLHAHLAQQISDYEIADLVEGISWLKHREDIVLTPRFQLGVIEDDRQKLTYYKLRIEEQGSETTA